MAGFNLGDIFVTFKAKTEDLERGVQKAKQTIDGVKEPVDSIGTRIKDFGRRTIGVLQDVGVRGWQALGIAAGAALAFISSRIGSAINRIDTLVNFPKVLQAMGSTAEEAKASTDKLAKSLQGLPTPLQDGAKGVQSLVAAGLSVPKATDAFLAMNNAMIAGGSNAQDTQIVMDSLTRAISAGSVDVSTMQAALSRMPTVLQALSKETGKSASELFNLYSTDPQKFIDDLIRLNKDGTGSIASLEKQARDATGGIGTAFDNLKNAIDRSWQAIVTTIGGGSLEAGQKKISDFITDVGQKFEKGTKVVAKFFKENGDKIKPFAAALGIAAAAFVGISMAVAAIGFLTSPITLIALAIGAVIVGLTYLQQKFDWIGKTIQFLTPLWQGLVDIFNKYLLPSLMALWNTFTTQLLPALMQIWDAVKRLWDAINPGFTEALKILGAIIGAIWIAQMWLAINVMNIIVQVISWIASGIANLINWIANLIQWYGNMYAAGINAVKGILNWFGKIPGAIGDIVNSVVKWFGDLPGRIGGVIGGIVGTITGPFKAAFNAIADFWNSTVGSVSFKAPDWVPGIGGKGWSIPKMPHLAVGTPNWRGGMATMNEFGPETAVLPKGTRVITADQTRRSEQGGGGDIYHIHLNGAFARSESELADLIEGGIQALDRRRAGAGKPQLLGGTT